MPGPDQTDTTANATASADAVRAELAELRDRARTWHEAADRAHATRYTERGGALDDTTRAAKAARAEANLAREQALRERETAEDAAAEAATLTAEAGKEQDPSLASDLREFAETRNQLAQAATQRAERAERAAGESTARADALDQQVTELGRAADDSSVAIAIGTAAHRLDNAADQLEKKVGLLDTADQWEADAAQYESTGDTVSAEVYRERAAELRAEADAIQPTIPKLDPRMLAAADYAWADAMDSQTAPSEPATTSDPSDPVGADGYDARAGESARAEGEDGTRVPAGDAPSDEDIAGSDGTSTDTYTELSSFGSAGDDLSLSDDAYANGTAFTNDDDPAGYDDLSTYDNASISDA
jgi:hypothetical protein